MSALMAMGLPPLTVRVLGQPSKDSYELPVLDGSSAPWMAPLIAVLGEPLRPPMDYFRVSRRFEFKSGDAWIRFEPVESLICEWDCRVDFGPRHQQDKVFLQNWLEPLESWKRYCQEIAPARTFGFRRELEDLAKRGLARGGSLSNALLLEDEGPTSGQSFKVESELAAHKLLDAMGDFGLAGRPLVGRLQLFKAGHALHLMALKEAFQQGVLEPTCLQDWI
jgi:UDP-3-O-[3-hydroxymyristoyl] N-acetylglucosamine deacetylase